MQRLASSSTALFLTLALAALPACKKGGGDNEQADSAKAGDGGDAKTPDETGKAEADGEAEAGAEAGAAEGEAGAEGEAAEAGSDDSEAEAEGAVEAGAEGGAGEAETGEEDPVPALLESAKSLDTEDDAATKALDDAVDAGANKLEAAKAANERGEALMTKGESERAEKFFTWAKDTHTLYAEPVYNLAKLSAYAGDLDFAKEHLEELKKRGNKKLMKKVGIDPAFTPLHDDPDVRKIYEQ